jgi:hypothetical protein
MKGHLNTHRQFILDIVYQPEALFGSRNHLGRSPGVGHEAERS